MDSRALTLLGTALGGIGIALIIDSRKQLQTMRASSNEPLPETNPVSEEIAEEANAIEDTPVERPPSPIKKAATPLKVPSQPATPSAPSKPGLVMNEYDMKPGESHADYYLRVAAFAKGYKDPRLEESSEDEDSDEEDDSEEEEEEETTPTPRSQARAPAPAATKTPSRPAARIQRARPILQDPERMARYARPAAIPASSKHRKASP